MSGALLVDGLLQLGKNKMILQLVLVAHADLCQDLMGFGIDQIR